MLSLDLFASKFERELREGAVDDLEYRRMNDLRDKMEYLMQAYKKANTDEQRRAIMQRYNEYKNEREGYLKVREAENPQQPPAKGLLKGKDLVTPQQRVAGATPTKPGIGSAIKNTTANFVRWLQGKNDIGPTYENVSEQDDINKFGPPEGNLDEPQKSGFSGLLVAEMLAKAWDDKKPYADIPFPGGNVTMSRARIYDLLYTLKRMNTNKLNATIENIFSDRNNFLMWTSQLKRYSTPVEKPQTQPGQMKLFKEAPAQKKNSEKVNTPQSLAVQRYLTKVRRKHPAAASDVEAIARDEQEKQAEFKRRIADLKSVNTKQDRELKQALDIDRQQSSEIDSIERDVEQLVQRVKQIKSTTPAAAVGPTTQKVSTEPVTTPKTPAAVAPTGAIDKTAVAQPVAARPIYISEPDKLPVKDKEIYNQVRDMEKDLKNKIDQVALMSTMRQTDSDAQEQLNALKQQIASDREAIVNQMSKLMKYATQVSGKQEKNMGKAEEIPQGVLGSSLNLLPEPGPKVTIPKSKKQDLDLAKQVISRVKAQQPAEVTEHGGGIGPKQRWQDLMPEGWSDKYDLTPYAVYIDGRQWKVFSSDEHARAVAEKVRANLKRQGRNQQVTIAPSQEYLKKESADQELVEGIKDTASATAVVACLLVGGSLSGCATAPQQTTAQQVLKTGQDVGRTVQMAKKITRAGTEEEVKQELRNLARGMSGQSAEYNNSNILRIWRKIKGPPPVQAEPEAPEYGPAPPRRRMPQHEAKEINTKEDFVRERDRLLRMITQETNPANKQILRSAIRQLESRAENEGWVTIQQRMIRESDYSKAAEEAILKRIMIAHTDLLKTYGPEKVMQAAEDVAYNVGDAEEIGSSDVSGWVHQVEQILGATP